MAPLTLILFGDVELKASTATEARKKRGINTMITNEVEFKSIPLPTAEMGGDELFQLGMMYSTGQGGAPVDLISAHMMFNLAAMRGSMEAQVYRKELSREMDREDIAEAQKAARQWLDAGRIGYAA
ncbi:Sel1 repeat-containing protein [Asticcacaulis taihuensis]|uniref:Sel1 repeat-containing protein n=2 Tax=Caulobacteraceae TaxID=76892 RepID=A0A1G4S570_9CAUL|nr:hypothetical protein SAMN02927928_2381 [Asticcacaulis taihuensis]